MFALWYFGLLILFGTIIGHTVLGFEQSWADPVVALLTAGACQLLLEWIDSRAKSRPFRALGGFSKLAIFFMPAWIVGLSLALLIYPGKRLMPLVFASAAAISSKVLFRAPTPAGSQHFFNPSNFGLVATLALFPSVGLAPPYHFTENVTGIWNWIVPGFVLITGVIVHKVFTGRLPVVMGWLTGFILQGLVRNGMAGSMSMSPFVPMTSASFILFTLYMIPDPATTPLRRWPQVAFGLAVASMYGILITEHVVFGLFIALAIVSTGRGIGMHISGILRRRKPAIVDVGPPIAIPVTPSGLSDEPVA
jgi:hypothetical protein